MNDFITKTKHTTRENLELTKKKKKKKTIENVETQRNQTIRVPQFSQRTTLEADNLNLPLQLTLC
jgi:hypothetical protein